MALRVLVVAQNKGGSGKSVTAASLAVAAMQDGESVAVVDTDPQGSVAGFGERREAKDIAFRTATPAALRGLVADIRKDGRISLAIVDTPGLLGPAVGQALHDADVVLVPSKAAVFDIEAVRPLAEQLQALDRRWWFVLTQVQASSPGRAIDAARALSRMGPLCPAMIGHRTDYLDCMIAGLGPTELAPKSRAAEEVTTLWQWTKERLDGDGAQVLDR